MLVVILECGDYVAIYSLTVNDKSDLLTAVVGIFDVKLIASEATCCGNVLPACGECRVDVETVVIAVETEDTLVAAHKSPCGCTCLPSKAYHHVHSFVLEVAVCEYVRLAGRLFRGISLTVGNDLKKCCNSLSTLSKRA
jgi:hypothetical protein